jgi:hypothetical protein
MAAIPKKYRSIRSLAGLRRHLQDEARARRLLEWLVWPDGRFCPHCGGLRHWPLKTRRPGLYECQGCGGQFSATARTPMHGTKLPIATWLEAAFLILASSKGISSLTLARHLGISQRAAWKVGHAVRSMMRPPADEPKLDGIVEVDDMADGGSPARRHRARYGAGTAKFIHNPPGRGSDKQRILVAVERGGRARTTKLADGSRATVAPAVESIVSPDAHLMTGWRPDAGGHRQGSGEARCRQSRGEGIRPRRRACEHGRRLQSLRPSGQDGRVALLERAASSTLLG